jgi:glutamate-5-semialdehyde dehydrogenase|tara:strand:+ start:678 stop:1868 length:1191 start_codon:yes stop_codon:yes gene_type:complete
MIFSTETKNKTLQDLADLIAENKEVIIEANKIDLELAGDIDPTLIDRLKVDSKKVDGMVASILDVITHEDPQGKVLHEYAHPNGMLVQNKLVPFGRILIIYESRPDVTIEAAITAFKGGNKILLKGGKESKKSNIALVDLWHKALEKNGIPTDYVNYLDIDRVATQKLLKENTHKLDLIIPRGGEGLINYIKQNTDVPLIISGRGNNFVYVHDKCDFDMAVDIIINGKSRLSVCNATDKVIINTKIPDFKNKAELLVRELIKIGMEVLVDGEQLEKIAGVTKMQENVYAQEFLSAKILISEAKNMDNAIETINKYCGGHSAVIIASNDSIAEDFQNEVDCACVYHNASSRFTDGGQLGFGAEIAISTQKLHFRGPVSSGQLVTNKWFIKGNGQIRG